ncbi:MAG: NHL repeat-containing protein [Candidatus Zixiibacteriota bacterium]
MLGCAGSSSFVTPQVTPTSELLVISIIDRDYLERLSNRIPGTATPVSTEAFEPLSMALSGDDALVIADPAGGRLWSLAGPGGGDGRLRPLLAAGITPHPPGFVRMDRLGNVFVTGVETGAVTICDPRLHPVGSIAAPYGALGLVIGRPVGIAFGLQGECYVSDQTNALVHHFDAAGGFVASFGGPDAGWGRVLRPEGLDCSPDGNEIYVCDPGTRRVLVYDPAGVPLREIGGTDLIEPRSVAVDRRGQCFVADPGAKAVMVFAANGRWIRTLTGLPPAIERFSAPCDVAVVDSVIWIADASAGKIVAVTLRPPHP